MPTSRRVTITAPPAAAPASERSGDVRTEPRLRLIGSDSRAHPGCIGGRARCRGRVVPPFRLRFRADARLFFGKDFEQWQH